MLDKLSIYDILSSFVGGVVLMTWLPICYPALLRVPLPDYPDDFKVVALTCAAVIVGSLLNTFAGKMLHRYFEKHGELPTDIALVSGLGDQFPLSTAQRIRAKMVKAIGEDCDARSLTLYAIQRTDAAGVGRVARFSALYAYQRSLFTLIVIMAAIFVTSFTYGAVQTFPHTVDVLVVVTFAGSGYLTYKEIKIREYYYAAELFLTMERILDGTQTGTAMPQDGSGN